MISSVRRALSALGFAAAVAPNALAAQTFEGMLTVRLAGMPPGAVMKTYFSRGKVRLEMVSPDKPPVVAILDPGAQRQYLLMPDQGVYMVMDLKEMSGRADSLARAGAARPGDGSLKATGRKTRIARVACEHYTYQGRTERLDLCLTTALGRMPAAAALFAGPPQPGTTPERPGWARALEQQKAFALRVADSTGGVVWEVMAVRRKALPAALFIPPAGLRPFHLPGGAPPIRPDGE